MRSSLFRAGGSTLQRSLLLLLAAGAGVSAAVAAFAQAPSSPQRTFTGIIADSECDDGFHGAMRMGETDADCVLACVDAHGARFVLRDNEADPKVTYDLTDQKTPARFAGRKVTVTGRLDAAKKMIEVESMAAAR